MKFVKLFVLGPQATLGRPEHGVRQYVQSDQGVCPLPTLPHHGPGETHLPDCNKLCARRLLLPPNSEVRGGGEVEK